jgi:hypothetical protein
MCVENKTIDLSEEKTEREHLEDFDNFMIEAAPKFFEWLGWVAALSAVAYLQLKQGSIALAVVYGIGIFLLFGYFNAFFYRMEFVFSREWSPKKKHLVSVLVSTILATITYRFVRYITDVLVAAQP